MDESLDWAQLDIPNQQLKDQSRSVPTRPTIFLPARCLPSQTQRPRSTSNRCPIWASSSHVWGSLGHLTTPAWDLVGFGCGVRQHPLGASPGARPPYASPVVQWEGSSSLVISSHQQQSTTTSQLLHQAALPAKHHTSATIESETAREINCRLVWRPSNPQYARLRLLKLQPQCGATRSGRPAAQGNQHRNNHCRVHI